VIKPKYIRICSTFSSSFGTSPLGESSGVNMHFGSAKKVQSQRYVANTVFVVSRRRVREAGALEELRYCRMIVEIRMIVMERSMAQRLLRIRRGLVGKGCGEDYIQIRIAPSGLW
jgi:hypothetical protein